MISHLFIPNKLKAHLLLNIWYKQMKAPPPIEYVGYTAILLGISSLIPQIIHLIEIKDASDISYKWLIIAVVGTFLWLIYSIFNKITLVALSSVCYIILYLVLIYLKYHYSKNTTTLAGVQKELGVAKKKKKKHSITYIAPVI